MKTNREAARSFNDTGGGTFLGVEGPRRESSSFKIGLTRVSSQEETDPMQTKEKFSIGPRHFHKSSEKTLLPNIFSGKKSRAGFSFNKNLLGNNESHGLVDEHKIDYVLEHQARELAKVNARLQKAMAELPEEAVQQ